LKGERTRYRNRIHGILIQQGLRVRNPSTKKFVKQLDLMRTWDGRELPPEMKVRLVRVHERLRLVEEQISCLVREKTQRLKAETASMAQVAQLLRLPGIGPVSSWTFVMEFFGWRRFRNRREVAALAGLPPTPYDSGKRLREQGISKAGNRRGAHPGHRGRLGLAAVSTPKQVKPVVPGTVCRRWEPHATHRHRGPGPPAAHRSVAFPGIWDDS
jgi:transposase